MSSRRAPIIRNASVIVIYVACTLCLFSSVLKTFSQSYIGVGADPILFMWFMKWLPYAIGHGLDPLWSNYVIYPTGINLMWNTWVPLASIVLWPITHLLGVLAAYNAWVMIPLPLAATSMYFVLRKSSFKTTPSFFGGLLFGFNPYMIAESVAHTHLTGPVFLLPVLFWVLWDVFGQQHRAWVLNGVSLAIVVVIFVFLGEEVLTTSALLSFVGIIVAYLAFGKRFLPRLEYILRTIALSVLIIIIAAGGALWFQITGPAVPHYQLQPPNFYVTDLLNFITPGTFQLIQNGYTSTIANHFTGNASEWTGYVGVPLICIYTYTWIRLRKNALLTLSLWMALITAVLSLGPSLHIQGVVTHIPLPWALLERFPIMNDILPARLSLYVFFFLSIILAEFIGQGWATQTSRRIWVPASVFLSLIALMPALDYPISKIAVPAFFTDKIHTTIPRNSVVLVLPFSTGSRASAMYWQQASGFWFKMPEGYAVTPFGFGPENTSVTEALLSDLPVQIDQDLRKKFAAYTTEHHIRYIILCNTASSYAVQETLVSKLLGTEPQNIEGVDIWAVSR